MPEPELQICPNDLDICAASPLGANGLRTGEVCEASEPSSIGEDNNYS